MPRFACLFAVVALLGCTNEDPAALFVDISYQLRCIDCDPRSPDGPMRDLLLVDGEMDTTLTCAASASGSTHEVDFSAQNSQYSLELHQVRLGANPGDQCQIEVKEGSGNTYRGGCKAVGSDDDAPCEVELTNEGGAITGSILCRRIQHTLTPTYTRYLLSPGSQDEAAEITIQGCAGL